VSLELYYIAIIALALPVGLICGFMPSLSMSVVLIFLYPLLHILPFDVLISFYVVALTTVYFSSSVIALWLGIVGDPTTFPIVHERDNIIANQQIGAALKRTAEGSAFSSIIGMILLFTVSFYSSKLIGFFVLTYTSVFILTVMLIVAVFWKENRVAVNLIMVSAAVALGNIGYNPLLDHHFLTFGNHWLYSGIPLLPVILGVYAIPLMYNAFLEGLESQKKNSDVYFSVDIPKTHVPMGPVVRGSLIGFIAGVVPLIGTTVCSNVAYFFEQKIKNNTALNRITAAESANSVSVLAVLAPLLLLGIAIVPSEMVLLSILRNQGWTINHLSQETLIIAGISVLITLSVCYVLCVHYAAQLIRYFQKYQTVFLLFFAVCLVYGVYFVGNGLYLGNFYLIVLAVSTVIGFVLRKLTINPIPFIIGMLLGENIFNTFYQAYNLTLPYLL